MFLILLSNCSVTDGGSLNLTDICNVGCDCWNVPFEPVCSIANNIQYYSPCHAGCTIMNETLSEDKVSNE